MMRIETDYLDPTLVLTNDDEGRRVAIVNYHGERFLCTVEARVGGGYVLIWDVTNLPLGLIEGDTLEWLS